MDKAKFYYKDKSAPKPNKPNHIGTCSIIKHDEKILMEYRSDSDYWALIGGGLKLDESLESGAIREINEETGLEINESEIRLINIYSDPSRIIAYPDGNVVRCITAAYLVNVTYSHSLRCSSESRQLKYFSVEEIQKLNIAVTHKHILEEYFDCEITV